MDNRSDMKWSRYNTLFASKRNGWLLFNSVSRAFMTVEEDQLETVRGIQNDPEGFDYSSVPMLYMQLRGLGFLVEDTRDDDYYNVAKLRNLTFLYADDALNLTIAITRACNFDCSYCFEGNRTGKPMSPEVEEKLIRFIRGYRTNRLNIVWYGGEPLLAFDRILSIDKKIKEMGKSCYASMITNGYLLTEEKIAKLNELNIGYLQITLDGNEETHDSRRYRKDGGKTYATILENVGKVMESDFRGTLHIRVNVDSRNEEQFADVYRYFQNRYPADFGRRITVYPGFVKGDDHPDCSCFFESERQGEFISKMYLKYGISPLSLFPSRDMQSCTLTKRHAFVVGPDGELYKCWDDVGIKEMVVGTLDVKNDWNMPLIAEGMVACSYLDSPECKECKLFPICNGGCHRIRMKNLHSEVKHSSCTYFKGNLENLLELYFESKKALVKKQKQIAEEQAAKQTEAEEKAAAEQKPPRETSGANG